MVLCPWKAEEDQERIPFVAGQQSKQSKEQQSKPRPHRRSIAGEGVDQGAGKRQTTHHRQPSVVDQGPSTDQRIDQDSIHADDIEAEEQQQQAGGNSK